MHNSDASYTFTAVTDQKTKSEIENKSYHDEALCPRLCPFNNNIDIQQKRQGDNKERHLM